MVGKRLVLLFITIVIASSSSAETVDPLAATDEIRRTALDPENAIEVSGFKLNAGLGKVVLDSGLLVPATPVAGRAVEFVFLGEGRIEIEPPDEIEAGQLELFTGFRSMDESFQRAILVVALDVAAEAVTRGVRSGEDADLSRAERVFDDWLASPERKLLDIEARIFADAMGDRLAAGFFCGSFDGTRLNRFLYVVDPLADEQVTVGQFVRPDLSRKQERKARRSIENAQRRGKLIGLEVEDLGIWDTWISSTQTGPDGRPAPGVRGVEPIHYDIDAILRGKKLELEGRVDLVLKVVVDGLRTVVIEMIPELEVKRVVDGVGRELEWFRSRNEVVVVLAGPAGSGDELKLGIEYLGHPIEQVAAGTWVLRHTLGWYPHAGSIDRATYTLTVHRPKRIDVVAPGSFENLGEDPDGLAVGRWRLDRPSIGVSFEVGDFDIATGRAGDVEITVAVDRLGQRIEGRLEKEILETVVGVVEYYSEVFGPYPLKNLRVVSSPRGFSQGLLGYVSLSTVAVLDWNSWGGLLGIEDRRTVIAHEVAHQWWGNLVGWRGYRDQWISEAMANYAALLWARNRLGDSGDRRLGLGPTANWKRELLRTTDDGRPIESLGPLVVGERLDSSISSSAYSSIVYKKGAVVLDMLSRFYREEVFLEILRRVVEAASDRILSTDDFLHGIAVIGGTDLEWFSRQYIRGTGLPEIDYAYDFEELRDGRWAVTGTAHQTAPYRYQYQVVQTSSGILDVGRNAESRLDVADSVLVVPFQIGVAGPPLENGRGRPLLTGRLVVAGETTPFRFETDHVPEVFWLDRESEVFGRFFAGDRWPRRMAYYRGLDLQAAGDLSGSRERFRDALAAEVAVVPPGWDDFFEDIDVTVAGERLDARIRLALARLDLDDGELASAKAELETARDLVKSRDRWLLDHDLLVVESRLLLLSGESLTAFKLLKKRVLGRRGVESRETWALLAIAAYRVGDFTVFAQARDRADELGVDLGPLGQD